MRGDATSRVLTGDAGLLTQRGNDTPIQIAVRKARAPKRKQKVDLFAGLLITRRRLIGAFLLPRANRLADDFLGPARAVHLGGVDEREAQVQAGAQGTTMPHNATQGGSGR